jgi:hypothetical protein
MSTGTDGDFPHSWNEDRFRLTTQIEDQYALMRIWRPTYALAPLPLRPLPDLCTVCREIIADLRLRLRFLQMWIWGFRRWHYNVVEMQCEAHAQWEAEQPEPKKEEREDWNLEAWDIYAIAASEFGMKDEDGNIT